MRSGLGLVAAALKAKTTEDACACVRPRALPLVAIAAREMLPEL